MSTAPRFLPRYTVEDYQSWQGDWELWDGIAVSMSPSPFGRHQECCMNLAYALKSASLNGQCDVTVLYEIDWVVSDVTVIRPDILVLCGDAPERHVERTPAIVAEILSPSTEHRDRNEKLELYQEQQVHHYFVLDPDQGTIEWFRPDPNGIFQRQKVEDQITLDICEDCHLEVVTAKLFQ